VYVAVAGKKPELLSLAMKVAREIREAGHPAVVGNANRSLKAQIGVADSLRAAYLLILGERDLAEGMYTLRNLRTHSEGRFALSDLPDFPLPPPTT
jgi:histidyl-tRNA synthetase